MSKLTDIYIYRSWFQMFRSDTISSHDKKRYYLECLEQYITYLHDQLRLVGHEPTPLERVSTYRGLTSRSIRVTNTLSPGTL